MKWIKSKFQGVRYREHPSRKHGVKPDRYYTIFYKLNGKMVQEALGWASESWEEVDQQGKKKCFNWTEKRAAAVLAELQKNHRLGTGPSTLKEKRLLQQQVFLAKKAEGLTLQEFWKRDYEKFLKDRIKPSSWQKEVAHFEKRICPLMGRKPLKSITHNDIDLLVNQMKAEGLSPRTQQYAVGTFFRIWKYAARRKLVKAGDNPAAYVEMEKVNNTRTRVLTPRELKFILDRLAIIDQPAYQITKFCAFTGCRFSEAANLKFEYVCFERQRVLFLDTKNKESRELYLGNSLEELLQHITPGPVGAHVFVKRDGTPFREPPSAFKTAVNALELNANRGPRDQVTFHTLRHSAATFSARNGISVKDMQLIFGWKTPAMVFRYVKGDTNAQKQAMQKLAESLSQIDVPEAVNEGS